MIFIKHKPMFLSRVDFSVKFVRMELMGLGLFGSKIFKDALL